MRRNQRLIKVITPDLQKLADEGVIVLSDETYSTNYKGKSLRGTYKRMRILNHATPEQINRAVEAATKQKGKHVKLLNDHLNNLWRQSLRQYLQYAVRTGSDPLETAARALVEAGMYGSLEEALQAVNTLRSGAPEKSIGADAPH
jgi:hypothetical protein